MGDKLDQEIDFAWPQPKDIDSMNLHCPVSITEINYQASSKGNCVFGGIQITLSNGAQS